MVFEQFINVIEDVLYDATPLNLRVDSRLFRESGTYYAHTAELRSATAF